MTEALPRYAGWGGLFHQHRARRVQLPRLNLRKRGWEFSPVCASSKTASRCSPTFSCRRGRAPRQLRRAVQSSDLEGLEGRFAGARRRATTVRGDIETSSRCACSTRRSNRRRRASHQQHPHRQLDLEEARGRQTCSTPPAATCSSSRSAGAGDALRRPGFPAFLLRVARYQPVRGTDVFILRGEAGVTLADSREGIPQDFFRTGGAQSVRGYDYQSLA